MQSIPGAASAKKIIAGRPYSTVDDLARVGIPAKTIQKIAPLVTLGATAMPSPTTVPPTRTESCSGLTSSAADETAKPSPKSSKTAKAQNKDKVAQSPPQKGMVWVNLDSGVYHKEGTRWYGRTKNGKFMNETDAIKAGYRAAKN